MFSLMMSPPRNQRSRPLHPLAVCGVLGVCLWGFGACGQRGRDSAALTGPEARLDELQKRLEEVQSEQEEQFQGLQDEIERRHADKGPELTPITCTESGFNWLTFDGFTFPVSCNNAVPYLGGYRLSLEIGNPYAASITGATVHVSWGGYPNVDKGALRLLNLDEEETRTATKEILTPLPPGEWTKFNMVINPATPEQASRVWLRLEFSGVAMTKARAAPR